MTGDNWERIITSVITILPVLAGIWISNRGLHHQMNSVLDQRVNAAKSEGKVQEQDDARARREVTSP